jgi:diaminopimelate decarboxylase
MAIPRHGTSAHDAGMSPGPWWAHRGLTVVRGRLHIAGRDAEDVARTSGTPLYAYDLTRIGEQIESLLAAAERSGLSTRVRVAMKAQHEPEILRYIRRRFCPRGDQGVGIDVSSPGEVTRALECGWSPELVSYTGTNLSERDLDVLLSDPIHINLDGIGQLRRVGRRAPGRRVGVRINPRVGAAHGMGSVSLYSGGKPTKFGVYPDRLSEAVAVAREYELSIVTLHAHIARMVLDEDLPSYDRALRAMAECARTLQDLGCALEEVNVGGGLGVPTKDGEEPLDLDRVVGLWKEHLAPLDVHVGCENGEFFSRDCGILLMEVVSVEERDGVLFVGVDAGWNVFNLPFIFGQRHPVVLCRDVLGASLRPATVAGNINQGPDLFAEDCPLPEVHEGDILAMLGAGAYAQAASLDTHCLRPHAQAVMFESRLP